MKKVITGILSVAFAIVCMSMAVFAESEPQDIEMSVTRAVQTNGSWGQSIIYPQSELNALNFTENTEIKIEFVYEGEMTTNISPAELILQNYEEEPNIWAKVSPVEFTDTSATFKYADMVMAYGSSDFSHVNNICVGDCGVQLTLTKFTVTNYLAPVITTTAATEETVTEAAPAEDSAVTEAPVAAVAEEPVGESNGLTIIIIVVVATVVIACVVVTLIVVKKNRKRFY